MASSFVLRRHIGSITQCPICLDVLDTPTSLPCLHTFCLRCLQSTFAADCPGDMATCPLCRQDFQLPAGGVTSLPRNFTLVDLVELCTTTRPTSHSAPSSVYMTQTVEPSLNDKSVEDEIMTLKMGENSAPATAANSGNTTGSDDCVDCSLPTSSSPHEDASGQGQSLIIPHVTQTVEPTLNDKSLEDEMMTLKMGINSIPVTAANSGNTTGSDDCVECSLSTSSSPHEDAGDQGQSLIIPASDCTLSSEVSTKDVTTTTCDKHTGAEDVEFCFDCRVDVCGACCDDVHSHHRRRPQNEVTAECRRRVASEMARVTDALNDTYVALCNIDQRRTEILKELRRKEDLARKECNEEDVDEVRKRLRVLSAEKDSDLRELARSKQRMDVNQTTLETFLKDGAQRLTTAATTTAGFLHLVKELNKEANSLLSVHQTRLDRSKLDGKQPTSLTELVTTLEDEKPVSALTTMDDELYIAHTGSHDIDVFDVESFYLRRRLSITSIQHTLLAVVSLGLASCCSVTDMASCRRYHCLYVADGSGGMVRRLDRMNGRQVAQWSVEGSSPIGLSVTTTFNVVVSCCDSLLLRVYSPHGCPLCEISIQRPGMVGLVHAVEQDSGSFLVIGETESGNRLACVSENNAELTADPIDSSGCPTYLALVGDPDSSYVWLAERGASAGVRMVQVPASQCSAKLPAVDLEDPQKMCWNESGQRLYVVDHGRVKIFRVHMKCVDHVLTIN